MSSSETAALTPELSSVSRVIVEPKDTVGALDSGHAASRVDALPRDYRRDRLRRRW